MYDPEICSDEPIVIYVSIFSFYLLTVQDKSNRSMGCILMYQSSKYFVFEEFIIVENVRALQVNVKSMYTCSTVQYDGTLI